MFGIMLDDGVVEINALLTDSAHEVHVGTVQLAVTSLAWLMGRSAEQAERREQLAQGTLPWYLRLGGWSDDDEGFGGADLAASKHI
jgi:hypothetical protein